MDADDVTPLERPGLVVDWSAFDRLGAELQALTLRVQAVESAPRRRCRALDEAIAEAGKSIDAALTAYRAIAQRARTLDGRAARVAPGPDPRA